MRPEMLSKTLQTLFKLGRSVHVEGPPGVGKTETIKQAVKMLGDGWHVVFKHAPTMQPEDLALPFRGEDGRLDFLKAGWVPLTGDFNENDRVVVMIDELPQADVAIQKTLANLMQEKELYGSRLHSGVTFVSTGNRSQDRAGANRILSHLRNRFTTIEFEASLDDWCNWALDNDVRPEIISFLRFKPGMLNDFDPQRDINPTPRAWVEGVNPIIDNVAPEAEFECIKGSVGEGAAAEFSAFLKICRKLPNPDAILMMPDKYEVPEDMSVRYALAGALAHRATPDNFDAVMTYVKRMPAEFTVLTVLDSVRKDKSLQNTKAFTQWAVTDGAKVLL